MINARYLVDGKLYTLMTPNVSLGRIFLAVIDIYGVDEDQAEYAITSAARSMGYPRPWRDGIWQRDLFGLLRAVDRRLA